MNILISHISKSFSTRPVLQDISLEVPKGACYCLLGPNGAGKSTLINILLDWYAPDEGFVQIGGMGYDGKNDISIKESLGAIADRSLLIDEFSGYQYLEFVGLLYSIPKSELTKRITSLAEFFFDDPKDLAGRVQAYSTGMRKKLELCGAMLHKPSLLILDEPFTGLDPLTAELFVNFITKQLIGHITLLISSHDLYYVEKIATHIGVLDKGILKFSGSLNAFTQSKASLGDALMNMLDKRDRKAENLSWLTA